MDTGSASCKACKKTMAVSTISIAEYTSSDYSVRFTSYVGDYYICQPGKPTIHKYCGKEDYYDPVQLCCVRTIHAYPTEKCVGKPVLSG
jgi:hypothetical protein